jgi:hypothetical protein
MNIRGVEVDSRTGPITACRAVGVQHHRLLVFTPNVLPHLRNLVYNLNVLGGVKYQ